MVTLMKLCTLTRKKGSCEMNEGWRCFERSYRSVDFFMLDILVDGILGKEAIS